MQKALQKEAQQESGNSTTLPCILFKFQVGARRRMRGTHSQGRSEVYFKHFLGRGRGRSKVKIILKGIRLLARRYDPLRITTSASSAYLTSNCRAEVNEGASGAGPSMSEDDTSRESKRVPSPIAFKDGSYSSILGVLSKLVP
jgi:hypothetical protein